LQQGDKNWDVSHFRAGTIDLLRKYYITNVAQDAELTRLHYVMRNYHDFWRLQTGYIRSMMMELALAGQADHQYLVANLAEFEGSLIPSYHPEAPAGTVRFQS
ncbi:unnamed protein product, partial [marine sediment metagenome]